MRRFLILILVVGMFAWGSKVFAQSTLPMRDRQQISNNLDSLVQAINAGDAQMIAGLISDNNPELLAEIQEQMDQRVEMRLDYAPLDEKIEVISQDRIRVKARLIASGDGWSVNGLSTYFVWEKQNDQWLITETDFYRKLGADYVFRLLKWVIIIGGPLFLLTFIFWVWMLIDCLKRDFEDKALWVILLIILTFFGAVLYYFIVKRKNLSRKPLTFKL